MTRRVQSPQALGYFFEIGAKNLKFTLNVQNYSTCNKMQILCMSCDPVTHE